MAIMHTLSVDAATTGPAGRPTGAGRRTLQQALQRVELPFDFAFGAHANPWRHLGAVSFFLFWIAAATGIYVYAAFDTSVAGAYASVERITHNAWPLSGLARSLHRYSSNAFVVVVLLHLAKEWINGHRAVTAEAKPLRAALIASIALFGAGGLIGFFIQGSNVKIPAHYHGCIVGVTIALMGLAYMLLLPTLGYARPSVRLRRSSRTSMRVASCLM